jgi:uncharacterized damage-inducible protein DinB
MLLEYLEWQRATVLAKADGLTLAQLATVHPPSSLTLAGILYHLALVEEGWMEARFAGRPRREPWCDVDWDADPDWEFRTAATLEPDVVRTRYREACARTNEVVAAAGGPEQLSVQPSWSGKSFSLRWVLLHLIEETARHAGHADFLREAIDGVVGE